MNNSRTFQSFNNPKKLRVMTFQTLNNPIQFGVITFKWLDNHKQLTGCYDVSIIAKQRYKQLTVDIASIHSYIQP